MRDGSAAGWCKLNQTSHLLYSSVCICVGIYIQCDSNIRMPHEVLQRFNVDAPVRHVGAESMAECVGRDARQGSMGVQAIVLLDGRC